jgi:cystathionine beta-lyase family protein involved in aluminum resistance
MLEALVAKERRKSLRKYFRGITDWKRKRVGESLKAKRRRELEIDITKVERKQEMTIDEIKENITGLIDDITAFNPHIKIGLAKIIPCRIRGFNEKIKEFNLWIEEMIKRKRELELKNNLFLVDMYEAFTKTRNPNEKGYELMANVLAKVIKEGSTNGEQGATSISQSTTITLGVSQQEMYQVIQSDVISSSSDR